MASPVGCTQVNHNVNENDTRTGEMNTVFLDFDSLGPGDLDLSDLNQLLPDLTTFPSTNDKQLHERICEAEVVMVNKVPLDDAALAAANRLKLICLAATGTDNIALDSARQRGIAVCNIRDYCTPSVVQHVFALILALTHHLNEYRTLLNQGAWSDSPQFCLLDFPIRELTGKTIGIVGLGSLGKGVASAAQTFGMTVAAAELPYHATQPRNNGDAVADIRRLPFSELLNVADIISLHCPLNDQTRHLIDVQALRSMRTDALLINTARGGLVNSLALIDALRDGRIAGAGIDVLDKEPLVDGDPLIEAQLDNLIVTPHIAWAARESRQRALNEMLANIVAFENGEARNYVC